jgi:hypothetical protein
MPDMELEYLMFALLGFGLSLVQSLLFMPLFLPVGMGMYLGSMYFFFNFYRGSQGRVCLESQRRLWTGIKSRALHMLGKCFTTKLHPQPWTWTFEQWNC